MRSLCSVPVLSLGLGLGHANSVGIRIPNSRGHAKAWELKKKGKKEGTA